MKKSILILFFLCFFKISLANTLLVENFWNSEMKVACSSASNCIYYDTQNIYNAVWADYNIPSPTPWNIYIDRVNDIIIFKVSYSVWFTLYWYIYTIHKQKFTSLATGSQYPPWFWMGFEKNKFSDKLSFNFYRINTYWNYSIYQWYQISNTGAIYWTWRNSTWCSEKTKAIIYDSNLYDEDLIWNINGSNIERCGSSTSYTQDIKSTFAFNISDFSFHERYSTNNEDIKSLITNNTGAYNTYWSYIFTFKTSGGISWDTLLFNSYSPWIYIPPQTYRTSYSWIYQDNLWYSPLSLTYYDTIVNKYIKTFVTWSGDLYTDSTFTPILWDTTGNAFNQDTILEDWTISESLWNIDTNGDGETSIQERLLAPFTIIKNIINSLSNGIKNIWVFLKSIMNIWNISFIYTSYADENILSTISDSTNNLYNSTWSTIFETQVNWIIQKVKYGFIALFIILIFTIFIFLKLK
jgi:hypothetical protein